MKEWREFSSDPANSPWGASETLELGPFPTFVMIGGNMVRERVQGE
jgi:hypothetical protein